MRRITKFAFVKGSMIELNHLCVHRPPKRGLLNKFLPYFLTLNLRTGEEPRKVFAKRSATRVYMVKKPLSVSYEFLMSSWSLARHFTRPILKRYLLNLFAIIF